MNFIDTDPDDIEDGKRERVAKNIRRGNASKTAMGSAMEEPPNLRCDICFNELDECVCHD